ncbi:MAG: hypothetical protein WC585_14620 [Brevundimonas sp.]
MGVGQNEQPLPYVRRARFSRREQARLDAVTQALKVSDDLPTSQGQMAFDVFEEDPAGADLAHDPLDLGPQVARIVFTAASAGLAEGLAGITGRDEMNAAAPRSAVEGSQIVPDRRRSQGLVFHPGHERGRSVGFPLDVTHSAIAGLGDMEPEVETAVAGAERKSPQICEGLLFGVKSHKARSLVRPLLGDRVGARGLER